MLGGTSGLGRQSTLMAEYSSVLADSVLRRKAWLAEHKAHIETQLANKVKSEFIANMSHELRTPLNTVIGFAKLLGEKNRRNLTDDATVEYAHLIRDAATHLLAVINDVLDISKMQSGKYALDTQQVDLAAVLRLSLAAFKPAALEVGVLLKGQLAEGLPAVKGDPDKLRQVFGNLISNAVKFTPPGGIVTVEARSAHDGGAEVRVRDTGLGMTREEIAVALTPFGQIDTGRARWRDGTGLGLPIAKALVQLHGGHLDIRSAKALGTEVIISLPPAFAVTDMHAPAAVAAPEGHMGGATP